MMLVKDFIVDAIYPAPNLIYKREMKNLQAVDYR